MLAPEKFVYTETYDEETNKISVDPIDMWKAIGLVVSVLAFLGFTIGLIAFITYFTVTDQVTKANAILSIVLIFFATSSLAITVNLWPQRKYR